MKFFDDIIKNIQGEADSSLKPKNVIVNENSVRMLTSGGELCDDEGTNVGRISMDLSTEDFAPKWRLRIPADRWSNTEVVSDGNSVDVLTTPMPDGRYKVKYTRRGFKPAMIVEEEELKLREFATTREFIDWIESQSTDTVEALRQIYYDRWNFDTGNQSDRMYYELLDEEKKGRR